jgi:hypothetical protein
MSEAPDFRSWAARVARQAGEEPDAKEAQRLMSIAEYWVVELGLKAKDNSSWPPRSYPYRWDRSATVYLFLKWNRHLDLPTSSSLATLWKAAIISSRGCGISAMDRSQEKKVVLPIEVMIAVAINIVVVGFGYYAITMWGLFSN